MKIYICGKVTGLPLSEAMAKFKKSEELLTSVGIERKNIVNPMYFGIVPEMDWHEAMAICIAKLSTCDAIYIQRDWRESFGARKEITVAMDRRLEMYFEDQNDTDQLAKIYKTRTA